MLTLIGVIIIIILMITIIIIIIIIDLRSGIKQMYPQHKVTQVNIVFDFLGNYYKDLKTQVHNHVILRNTDKQQISSKITSEKETRYLLQKSQKWILSQNVEIVKRLYRN